jgi:hypothetical protein
MIDTVAATLALRNRLLTLVVATTGGATLSATANGYARTVGSFIDDRFRVGEEITPAGFGANVPAMIVARTATLITTDTTHTVEAAAAGRSLSVGVPTGRAFELVPFIGGASGAPIAGRPYIQESLLPGGQSSPGFGPLMDEDGLYSIKWVGLEGKGTEAIRDPVNAIKALFAPGTKIPVGAADFRVRKDLAPSAGEIIPQGDGWAICEVLIPWKVYS